MKDKMLCLTHRSGSQVRLNTKYLLGYEEVSEAVGGGSVIYMQGDPNFIRVTATVSQLDEAMFSDGWEYVDPIEEAEITNDV